MHVWKLTGFKSKTVTYQLDLTREAKIALMVDQIRKKQAEMYVEEVKAEFLRSRTISGNPEYSNALKMSEMSLREGAKVVAWFRKTLDELQAQG